MERAPLRRATGLLVVWLLLLSAVVVYDRARDLTTPAADAQEYDAGSSAAPSTPAPSTPAPPGQPPTGAAPETEDDPEAPSPPSAGLPRAGILGPGLPTSGPGIDEPGVLLVATALADGSFEVTEQVLLEEPTTALVLAPTSTESAGRPFADTAVVAAEVQVTSAGQPVVVPEATVSRRTVLTVPATREVTVSYRWVGATVRSVPSTARRALAVVGPLTGPSVGDLPVSVVVPGETVRTLTCPMLPPTEQVCGSGDPAAVVGSLTGRDALVVVQLDLPTA